MEFGVFSLGSAIRWYVDYFSNGEAILTDEQVKECESKNCFPHLKYFYDSSSIVDIKNIENYEDVVITSKSITNIAYIHNIPNKIIVETRVDEKSAKDFSFLNNELAKESITLEKVIDIEFFETYKAHENYLIHLDCSLEEILERYSDETSKMGPLSHRGLVRKLYESEFKNFEEVLFGEEPAKFYDLLDDNISKISTRSFSAFLDTEKIHIQFAICSFGKFKEIPVLAYFGYGNYYPFASYMKNKNDRYNRFSQLNHGDLIDLNYYISEIKKSKNQKTREIQSKINECQLGYLEHYNSNLNFYSRRSTHMSKHGNGYEFPEFVDRLMMLEPATRTKSAALIAYDYPYYT
ncbi:hypothetical protein [Vibrio jasicida]|uniref:hypothetical protein n=4 Tax=Vibrio jasicida TaxID=766224 RepID=UPI00039B46C5|nr:hypothetical protein [Vibrio jasicida]